MNFIDHYVVLGLPTGEEGAKLTERQITKAFKGKALEVHPDKRPDQESDAAHTDFQKLKDSYQVLSNAKERRQFHAVLLSRRHRQYPGKTRFVRVVRKEPAKRKYEGPDYQESERKRQAIEKNAELLKILKGKLSALFASAEDILEEDDQEEPDFRKCQVEKMALFKKMKEEMCEFFADVEKNRENYKPVSEETEKYASIFKTMKEKLYGFLADMEEMLKEDE